MFKRKHTRGRKKIMSVSTELSEEHAETDENDNSNAKTDIDGRFGFTQMVSDEAHMQKKNILESKKKISDSIATET